MLIESDDSLVEEVPKRNGGVQQVSLCTIMQHLNNNKQITSLINNKFESLKQNNQQGFPQNSNQIGNDSNQNNYNQRTNDYRANRHHPYQRPGSSGKSTDFTNSRSQVSYPKRCYVCGASDHLRSNCPNRSRELLVVVITLENV